MNLLEQTKKICKLYDIQPARSKGQNFLIREEVYDKIVEVAEIKKDETILEVGPGLGFLTAKLAKKAKKVIAVELDDKIAETLKIALLTQEVKNIEIINKNVLDIQILASGYKIVANLPYNITSVFLRKFLSTEHRPDLIVLMLQKEVAERIAAKPGQMSLLAVSVQFYAEAEIIQNVPADNFWPAPKVDSAIIKLKVKHTPALPRHPRSTELTTKSQEGSKINEKDFFRLVKFGFGAKRKMLKNNLAGGYHISQAEAEERIIKAGFEGKIRAQELSVEDWGRLLKSF